MAKGKPTKKQIAIVRGIKRNLKNKIQKPLSVIAKEAGYSKNVSAQNKNITESLGFQDLLAKELPESEVLKVHRGLLKSHKIEYLAFPIKEKNEKIESLIKNAGFKFVRITKIEIVKKKYAYFLIPENKSRANAVDMFYKLKGSYASDKIEDGKYTKISDEELDEMLEEGVEVEVRFKKYKKITKIKPKVAPQSQPNSSEPA